MTSGLEPSESLTWLDIYDASHEGSFEAVHWSGHAYVVWDFHNMRASFLEGMFQEQVCQEPGSSQVG